MRSGRVIAREVATAGSYTADAETVEAAMAAVVARAPTRKARQAIAAWRTIPPPLRYHPTATPARVPTPARECYAFREGNCPRGNNCRFSHGGGGGSGRGRGRGRGSDSDSGGTAGGGSGGRGQQPKRVKCKSSAEDRKKEATPRCDQRGFTHKSSPEGVGRVSLVSRQQAGNACDRHDPSPGARSRKYPDPAAPSSPKPAPLPAAA
eukprot:g53723.t1